MTRRYAFAVVAVALVISGVGAITLIRNRKPEEPPPVALIPPSPVKLQQVTPKPVIYDWSNWDRRSSLEGPRGLHSGIAFSRKGDLLAYGTNPASRGMDGGAEIVIWNVSDARVEATLNEEASRVSAVGFSPDGSMLAVAAYPVGHVYAAKTWAVRFNLKNGDVPKSLAFTTDSKRLFYGSARSVWDMATGEEQEELVGKGAFVAASPSGSLVSASDSDCCLSHAVTGQRVGDWSDGCGGAREFSPDGKLLVLIAAPGLQCWDVTNPSKPTLRSGVERNDLNPSCLSISPDGMAVVVAAKRSDGRWEALVYSLPSLSLLYRFDEAPGFVDAAFQPRGSLLATVTPGNEIVFWQAAEKP